MKRYGVVFWNEEKDHSIYVYCFARDNIEAQNKVDAIAISGYIAGPVSRLYKQDWLEYPILLAKIGNYVK